MMLGNAFGHIKSDLLNPHALDDDAIDRRIAGQSRGIGCKKDFDVSPGIGKMPCDDKPISAIVAAATDYSDSVIRLQAVQNNRRRVPAGILHQYNSRNSKIFDAAPIHFADLVTTQDDVYSHHDSFQRAG